MLAQVDPEDYERFNQFNWTCCYGYAMRQVMPGKRIFLHVAIMDPPPGMEVDHRNGDRLDNRRANLRICTHHQNSMNRVKKKTPWPYKGVRINHSGWQARIRHNGKEYHLGVYETAEEAARAYDNKALELFGEFARLNLPDCVGSQPKVRERPRGCKKRFNTYKGIRQLPSGRWQGVCSISRKQYKLGTYETPEEAARAYDKKALELFGRNAVLNFPAD